MYVAPAPARYSTLPQLVPHDSNAVERTAPVAPAATELTAATGSIVGGVARAGTVFLDHVIAGLEFGGGSVSSDARDLATTNSAVALDMAAVVGVTTQYTSRVSVGAELAGVLRKLERHSDDNQLFFVESDAFAEARLRAHIWLLPFLGLGAYVAVDEHGLRGGGLRLVVTIPDSHRRR